MLYQGDVGLYLSGSPVPVNMCAIYITQPTIKQIIQFGEVDFLMAVHLLTNIEDFLGDIRNQGNLELDAMSNFQILLMLVEQDPSIKKTLNTLFELIFPDYDIKYTKNSMNFSLRNDENKNMIGQITPFTFEIFQRAIKELFSLDGKANGDDYNPANEAAKEIAKKLKRGKQKINELAGKNNKGDMSLFGTYASILSIGMMIDINVFFNYTPFQLQDSFNRYLLKVKYDLYQKVSTTPMMDTSKMEEPEE